MAQRTSEKIFLSVDSPQTRTVVIRPPGKNPVIVMLIVEEEKKIDCREVKGPPASVLSRKCPANSSAVAFGASEGTFPGRYPRLTVDGS